MIRGRLPTAVLACVCGLATGMGGLLKWIGARGARPSMGMDHTSFSKMLVYILVNGQPFMKSVGFVMLLLGVLMVIGGLSGLRVLTMVGAVLALGVAGMWIGLTAHHYNTPQFPNSYYLNPAHLPWSDLRGGAWLTLSAALLGLVSAFVRRGRKPAVRGAIP